MIEDVVITKDNGIRIALADDEDWRTPYFDEVLRTDEYVSAGIYAELKRHFRKRGDQYLRIPNWVMVIDEEYGEAIRALNEKDYAQAKKELIETITCCVRLVNEIEAVQCGGRPGDCAYREQD